MAHPSWHGHVSAISVAPEFRRTGVANRLMEYLEEEGSFRGVLPPHDEPHGNLFMEKLKSRLQSRRIFIGILTKAESKLQIPNIDVVVILDIFRYF